MYVGCEQGSRAVSGLPKSLKVHGSDRCTHCGCWSGDCDVPFVIYTKARAEWLERGAAMADAARGDDEWLDWIAEGKRLTALKE